MDGHRRPAGDQVGLPPLLAPEPSAWAHHSAGVNSHRRRGDRIRCHFAALHESVHGIVSRVTPVHTALRNCTRDEGGPLEAGTQVLTPRHPKLLSSKAMVVNVAEKSERDFGRYD